VSTVDLETQMFGVQAGARAYPRQQRTALRVRPAVNFEHRQLPISESSRRPKRLHLCVPHASVLERETADMQS
jgi:hypothetical protein